MARNQEVNQKMKKERREKILQGALKLFARNGFSGTKISDVAEYTKMSNGLIYHYFPSKESLFTELIRVAFERLLAACRWLDAADYKPEEKIKYALDELVRTMRTNQDACLYHLLIAQALTAGNIPVEAKKIIETNRNEPYETIAGILSAGQQNKTIRKGSVNDMAFFFWTTINGLALHQAMYGEHSESPDLTPLYNMFF